MGLLAYTWNRWRRTLSMLQHDTPRENECRDDEDRRDDGRCLEHHLREEVRRYEDDLRELAKT